MWMCTQVNKVKFAFMLTLMKSRDIKQSCRSKENKKVTICVGISNATWLVGVSSIGCTSTYSATGCSTAVNQPRLHREQKNNKASKKPLESFQSSLSVWLLQSTINKLKRTGMLLLRSQIKSYYLCSGSGMEKNMCSHPPTNGWSSCKREKNNTKKCKC